MQEGVAPSPENFFGVFDAKSRAWGQFGPENKLIVPAPKYLPERRSTTFPHHYTPVICVCTLYGVFADDS